MNRTCLITIAFVLATTVASAWDQGDYKPNIIYIMADDLGYGDLVCFRKLRGGAERDLSDKAIRTPHIDRLAADGMTLTDHYAGHTVCRPSRLVLLTGRHTGHTGISSNAPYTMKPSERSVTTLLKAAGYRTGGVGKWAMGLPETTGVPSKQGFDFWYGYLNQSRAHNYYPEYLWKHEKKDILSGNKEVGKNISDPKVTYSHTRLMEEANAFIIDNAKRPFFLQMHITIPHTNNEAGRARGDGQEVPDYGRFKDKKWPNPEKGFAAMIELMDSDIGRMMALLKELGIDNKTLVIFTSDNGPHQEGGHKMEYFDSNGKLRGSKRDLYDGGIRVPFIARWPGVIKPGTTSAHRSAFWDFLPTACELAGAAIPKDIDGISYLPTLLGKEQKKHDYLYWQALPKQAVRIGKWKGVIPGKNNPLEVYDLSTDIGEETNLAAKYPTLVKQLEAAIEDASKK